MKDNTMKKNLITFVTSVRHPDNSNDYELVWKLLENTLISVSSQTNQDFEIIVVANKILDDFSSHPIIKNIKFIKVGFSAPITEGEKIHTGMKVIEIDRGTKYAIGAVASQSDNIMFFDADDFVHKDIVQYISDHPDFSSYKIKKGYTIAGERFNKNNIFQGCCGTSQIVKTSCLLKHLKGLNINSNQQEILEVAGDYFVRKVLGDHHKICSMFQPCHDIPFRAAVYYLFNGQNHGLKMHWLNMLEKSDHWMGGTNNAEGFLIKNHQEFISDFNINLLT